jgi:hypothetical protein
MLYSFLNSADPGTLNVAQAFFQMPMDIAMTVMPFINMADGNWTAIGQQIPAIGTGSQDGFESCRRMCGLAGEGGNGTGNSGGFVNH